MDFTALLAAVAGLAAAAVGFLQARFMRRLDEEARKALSAAQEPRVDLALREGDLKSLGDFFFNNLGRLSLSDYADDTEARKIVSGAVRNVEMFLDAERPSVWEVPDQLADAEARKAERDISGGDYWAGLSRLRRAIELALRDAAKRLDIPAERMGASQLLGRLAREERAIPPGAVKALKRSIAVCNRGVHGERVSGAEAEEALALAAEGLTVLRAQ
jgi:hypothetical protein